MNNRKKKTVICTGNLIASELRTKWSDGLDRQTQTNGWCCNECNKKQRGGGVRRKLAENRILVTGPRE
jgi:hypothetical protein